MARRRYKARVASNGKLYSRRVFGVDFDVFVAQIASPRLARARAVADGDVDDAEEFDMLGKRGGAARQALAALHRQAPPVQGEGRNTNNSDALITLKASSTT